MESVINPQETVSDLRLNEENLSLNLKPLKTESMDTEGTDFVASFMNISKDDGLETGISSSLVNSIVDVAPESSNTNVVSKSVESETITQPTEQPFDLFQQPSKLSPSGIPSTVSPSKIFVSCPPNTLSPTTFFTLVEGDSTSQNPSLLSPSESDTQQQQQQQSQPQQKTKKQSSRTQTHSKTKSTNASSKKNSLQQSNESVGTKRTKAAPEQQTKKKARTTTTTTSPPNTRKKKSTTQSQTQTPTNTESKRQTEFREKLVQSFYEALTLHLSSSTSPTVQHKESSKFKSFIKNINFNYNNNNKKLFIGII
jgi:hypothetical protein